ncbi:DNA topoisomerase IV subunit B [Crenobacter cavernae]|uniref:DNA topoisomerase 4 subunit B n=1 Tax=Crenobacter cavernae TaxID=2290923 RepID=A0A345Y347_9NEIS|nr:DNA topoisomerase IV subunit B [Crenobacter cavernae]AXK38349.1 DNA topoisomerase IV subunit B [Crenobacter cavernae]
MTQSYDESSVRVLKGLEPVKERPGMYTRTTDPTHICQEVIDNAADEALGGYAKKIAVTVHLDGSLSVEDDGRGIPVGLHPTENVPVVELVFTRLHAGGKFNKKDGGAYAFSGGLHGVGVSVTNALSTRLEVEVKRDGGVYKLAFSGGDVIEPLTRVGDCGARTSGTRVRVWPDGKYFESPRYSMPELERLLRAKAVLLPGVAVTLVVEKPGGLEEKVWHYPDGLKSYLEELFGGEEPVAPAFAGEAYIGPEHDSFAPGEGASWALAWFEDGAGGESYVNLIPTPAGGTHEAGIRAGVFDAVKSFIDHHNLLPRGVKVQAEDVWSRVRFVLSTRVLDPQFQGQTKEKLTSRDALKLVSSVSRDPVELWLNQHVEAGKRIAELAIRQAQSRLKSVKKVEKKKGSGVAVLPGKLTDCESEDIARNELFLVEGDSAGGSAKLARDKEYQAILPLRGKVLNSWETDRGQLFSNTEIHDIAVAIGVDPHGPHDSPDLSGLRYGKISILSDADVDGSHIQVLLLTLFFKHFPKLIDAGHIYIAQPPLFRVDVPGQGKSRPPKKLYALDEGELEAILDRLRAEGVRENAWSLSRFKGLGEMNPEQLKDTTMHPDTRRLTQVRVRSGALDSTRDTFVMLMGKGEAASRRSWMEARGNEVEADI